MKVLPPDTQAWLENQPNIAPCFLIDITLDEPLHLSTRQEVTYGGVRYSAGRTAGELQISQDEASFGVINDLYKYTTPALTGVYQRAPVKIWWFESSPILLFEGNISHFNQITSVLGVVASRSAARRYPTLRVLPPVANYVAAEGSVFTIGSNTYRLEARS